jgi:hypothetical protein
MNLFKIMMGTIGYYIDKYSVHMTLLALGYFLCHIIHYLTQ